MILTFKRECEEDRLPANLVLEMLMKLYLRGEFELGMIAKKTNKKGHALWFGDLTHGLIKIAYREKNVNRKPPYDIVKIS